MRIRQIPIYELVAICKQSNRWLYRFRDTSSDCARTNRTRAATETDEIVLYLYGPDHYRLGERYTIHLSTLEETFECTA